MGVAEALDALDAAVAKRDKGRAAAGLAAIASPVISREEHETALAAAKPRAEKIVDYFAWKRRGESPEISDEDEEQLVAKDDAWLRTIEALPQSDVSGRAFALGLRAGYSAADPNWKAVGRKRAERQRAFDASPEGRAQAAWLRMLRAARKFQENGGVRALLDNPPLAPEDEDDQEPAGAPPVKVPPWRKDKDEPTVVATAKMILEAGRKRRGETVVELPTDPTARAIVLAAARSRGEKLKES